MTSKTKPTSKVIQISSIPMTNGVKNWIAITALCEDGSIWQNILNDWECILGPSAPPKSDLPMPGSWWKKRGRKDRIQVSGIWLEGCVGEEEIIVNCCHSDGSTEEETLEAFKKIFKPAEAPSAS